MEGTIEINAQELVYMIGAEIDHVLSQGAINIDYLKGLKKAQQIVDKMLEEKAAALRQYLKNELKTDA